MKEIFRIKYGCKLHIGRKHCEILQIVRTTRINHLLFYCNHQCNLRISAFVYLISCITITFQWYCLIHLQWYLWVIYRWKMASIHNCRDIYWNCDISPSFSTRYYQLKNWNYTVFHIKWLEAKLPYLTLFNSINSRNETDQ